MIRLAGKIMKANKELFLDNLKRINEKIAIAAEKSRRLSSDIVLVAVTKSVDLATLQEVACTFQDAGIHHFGENKAQELMTKQPYIEGFNWHFLGHLQRNKVLQVIDKVNLIHSLDSLRLAQEISRVASLKSIVVNTLIEVNIACEPNKYGVNPDQVLDFFAQIEAMPNISINGLMTMGPLGATEQQMRSYFDKMTRLHEDLKKAATPKHNIKYLSMGMSNDYAVAIEHGANIVRVGRGIFGERKA